MSGTSIHPLSFWVLSGPRHEQLSFFFLGTVWTETWANVLLLSGHCQDWDMISFPPFWVLSVARYDLLSFIFLGTVKTKTRFIIRLLSGHFQYWDMIYHPPSFWALSTQTWSVFLLLSEHCQDLHVISHPSSFWALYRTRHDISSSFFLDTVRTFAWYLILLLSEDWDMISSPSFCALSGPVHDLLCCVWTTVFILDGLHDHKEYSVHVRTRASVGKW